MTRNLGALREADIQTTAEDVSATLRAGYIYQGGRHEPFPFIMSEIQDNVNAPATLTLVSSPQIPEGPLEARGGYSTNAWNTEAPLPLWPARADTCTADIPQPEPLQ